MITDLRDYVDVIHILLRFIYYSRLISAMRYNKLVFRENYYFYLDFRAASSILQNNNIK